jgi:hypothetical protein
MGEINFVIKIGGWRGEGQQILSLCLQKFRNLLKLTLQSQGEKKEQLCEVSLTILLLK